MSRASEELYVGYLPASPPALATRTRLRVVALAVIAAALAAMLVLAQSRFGPGVFEYGTLRELSGTLEAQPYPVLAVPRPGGGHSRYLLSSVGKHGALELAQPFLGEAVRVRGTLVHRDGVTMVEIAEDGVRRDESARPGASEAPVELAQTRLVGEIVDSKCYLGVMKPGNTKAHRDCAVRCISGGVPPVLLVRDAQGAASYYLLAGPNGETLNEAVLEHVAEPIEVEGRVQRLGDLLLLRADPARFRRLE